MKCNSVVWNMTDNVIGPYFLYDIMNGKHCLMMLQEFVRLNVSGKCQRTCFHAIWCAATLCNNCIGLVGSEFSGMVDGMMRISWMICQTMPWPHACPVTFSFGTEERMKCTRLKHTLRNSWMHWFRILSRTL